MDSATNDWFQLEAANPFQQTEEGAFYRKVDLYTMAWNEKFDINRCTVAAAPYGGPIAAMRSSRRGGDARDAKPLIYIFTSSGFELAVIKWDGGKLIQMGWSSSEELLCVQDDGQVYVYSLLGNFLRTFSFGVEVKKVNVIDAKIFPTPNSTGIAVLDSAYRIYLMSNIDQSQVRRVAEVPGLDSPPSSWIVVPQEKQLAVLVAREQKLYYADCQGPCVEQSLEKLAEFNAITEMALSLNYKQLALFTDSGHIWIGSANFRDRSYQVNIKRKQRPSQMVWCGTGALVLSWNDPANGSATLMVVDPLDRQQTNVYFSSIALVPEVDGVRVISAMQHELLQKVSRAVFDVLSIGSMSPGALLLEASKFFYQHDKKADEYLKSIRDLRSAVDQCIIAAGYMYQSIHQKELLKAASFGRSFLDEFPLTTIPEMCNILRVLNSIRNHRFGIPLTYTQFQHLSTPIIIDRLLVRQLFPLAIKIARYMKMPENLGTNRILAHWACYKVDQKGDEEAIARAIAAKLEETPGLSYSEVAMRAIDKGKRALAIKLLDYEQKASEQIPLLMKVDQMERALEKAIQSGNSNLIYSVLLHMKDKMALGEFLMKIRQVPVAHRLYMQYCRESDPQMLEDLYSQEDDHDGQAFCHLLTSCKESSLEEKKAQLKAAKECYLKSSNEFAIKVIDDQVKLMDRQKTIEDTLKRPYLFLSLHQTIHQLVCEGEHKLAETFRKDFKVADRRYWWIRIQALAGRSDWAELEKFSKQKKSPIGYEPFIEMCMKYNNKTEAMKYLSKVAPEKKAGCLILIGELDEAAAVAFQQQDMESLNKIITKCGTTGQRDLIDKVNQFKSRLGPS